MKKIKLIKNSILFFTLVSTINVKAQTLPTWVPEPGQVSVLTVANGGLANNFRSQCVPYYDPWYYVKTSNTYGGAFKNPYWGKYGCMLFFSGGHANTNDNSVTVAEYGQNNVKFKLVCDPTPWFGKGTDDLTKGNNGVGNANAMLDITSEGPPTIYNYGISTIDGKPGSSHTYGSGDFIGPEFGGAANGTYLRAWTPAINTRNQYGAVSALALDLSDTSTASSARNWRKQSLTRIDENLFGGAAPVLTQFVGLQQRVYIVTNGNNLIRWFDVASGLYVTGKGIGFDYDFADGFDGGTMIYLKEEGLLVCCYKRNGFIEMQWMDVTVDEPSLGGTVKLSTTLEVPEPWGSAAWCPDNNRIILRGILNDNSAVYEVEMPSVLTNTWTVTRAPFPNGQTLPSMSTASEFKRFHYDEKIRAIFYFQRAMRADEGEDIAYVYRPRNTEITSVNNSESQDALLFTAYPNPFNSITTINISLMLDSKNGTLQVFNTLGKLVADLTNQIQNKTVQFNSEGLTEGIYVIRLSTGDKTFTRKVSYVK